MARKRFKKSYRGRGKAPSEGDYVLIAEIVEHRDPAILAEMSIEALEILEDPEVGEDLKAFAWGKLSMSMAIAKVWRFYIPQKVEVGWIFENQRSAEMVAEVVGRFARVVKSTKVINGKEHPCVFTDWAFWRRMGDVVGVPPAPVDLIAQRFIEERNPQRSLERLAEDLVLLSMVTGTEPTIADIDENHSEE